MYLKVKDNNGSKTFTLLYYIKIQDHIEIVLITWTNIHIKDVLLMGYRELRNFILYLIIILVMWNCKSVLNDISFTIRHLLLLFIF